MANRTHVAFNANDRSYFAILKKEIRAIAASANFTDRKIGEIDIIVAELVSNLAKHAGGGQLFVKLITEPNEPGIEIISVDHGPGISDVNRMMTDGVSTKNTLGQGLGAIKRLSNFFQVFSLKNWGTIMLVRVFENDFTDVKKTIREEIKSVVLPKPPEIACGDGFFYKVTPETVQVFLGDGLGHGPAAAAAVTTAGNAFLLFSENDPIEIIRHINTAVKKTRGLVGTVAVFNMALRTWRLCGVGNIATRIVSPVATKNYLSYNGIIGLNVPNTLNAQEIEHENGQCLIMCSDGIKSRWDIAKVPGLFRCDLSIVAAAIIKDFARNTDDMSAMACKINL